jgi:thioredoxin-like negative regulator of GroEL
MSDLATFTRPTLIEVMTPHCVECRAMQPDLDAVAEEYEDSVDLVVLDATKETDLVASLRVLGTPTLIAVSEGVEMARFAGRRSRSELAELFSAVAAGEADSVASIGRGDRIVWAVGGALLATAGLLSGPSWILVAAGAALAGYAALRSVLA